MVDDIELRGILKNRKVKPKPYHLGDNLNVINSWELKTEPEIEQTESQPVIEFENNEKESDQNSLLNGKVYKLSNVNGEYHIDSKRCLIGSVGTLISSR